VLIEVDFPGYKVIPNFFNLNAHVLEITFMPGMFKGLHPGIIHAHEVPVLNIVVIAVPVNVIVQGAFSGEFLSVPVGIIQIPAKIDRALPQSLGVPVIIVLPVKFRVLGYLPVGVFLA
jgi:hypothetical protein